MGLDVGPKTLEIYREKLLAAKTIVWNGPMGVFEMSNFNKGTFAIAETLSEATEKGALTVVGGGDSVAAIVQAGFEDKSATSPQAAVPCSNSSRARPCRESPR
jgi:phosphoglycerate kinase